MKNYHIVLSALLFGFVVGVAAPVHASVITSMNVDVARMDLAEAFTKYGLLVDGLTEQDKRQVKLDSGVAAAQVTYHISEAVKEMLNNGKTCNEIHDIWSSRITGEALTSVTDQLSKVTQKAANNIAHAERRYADVQCAYLTEE